MTSILKRRALAAALAFFLSIPAVGQVFVRTVLDRKNVAPEPSHSKVHELTNNIPFGVSAEALFVELPQSDKDKVANAALDEHLTADFNKLFGDKVDKDEFNKRALDICDKVGWTLKNRWKPVRWKSERSACFWSQPSIDFAHAAQIVGGDKQGTASVEVVSDVFWGLRVRVQSGVSGSDSSDPDAQAKALLKQLQTSGGNFSVGATYPWYALERPKTPGHPELARVHGLLTSFIRAGGAIPALGADTNSTTIKAADANGSVELALVDSSLEIQSFTTSINFVMTGRASVVNGTHAFNDAIKNTGHRGFAYGQIGAGFRFADSVWIIASRVFYSHKLPGSGMTYSVLFGK
jgi:hypothetical protein